MHVVLARSRMIRQLVQPEARTIFHLSCQNCKTFFFLLLRSSDPSREDERRQPTIRRKYDEPRSFDFNPQFSDFATSPSSRWISLPYPSNKGLTLRAFRLVQKQGSLKFWQNCHKSRKKAPRFEVRNPEHPSILVWRLVTWISEYFTSYLR